MWEYKEAQKLDPDGTQVYAIRYTKKSSRSWGRGRWFCDNCYVRQLLTSVVIECLIVKKTVSFMDDS